MIASMAVQLGGEYDLYMVSKDKDLRQVVGPNVRLYDVTKDEEYDADDLRQKLGYGPEQAIDVQSLMGDNIRQRPRRPRRRREDGRQARQQVRQRGGRL